MLYRIEIKASAAKEIASINDRSTRSKVLARIEALGDHPRPVGAEKLAGAEAYRIRQGDFRIVYTVEDLRLVVEVVNVGNRREVYRRR